MGTQYYDWDAAWDFVTYSSGSDIDGYDLDDETTLTSDAISLDQKAAVEISVKWVEGGDGAVDGDVYVYVLRDTDGTNYQTINDNPTVRARIDVVASTTRYAVFTIDAREVSSFKILVDNDSGQDGALTIKSRFAVLTTA